ncbi:MAG TPA: YeiH family protein [Woeseiaceae bacterium]|nr:YeiH family protein [Woeseiaceae bacterium]
MIAFLRRLAPGLLLACFLGLAALALTEIPLLARWQVSALTLAIVLGMLLGNTFGRHLPPALAPGIGMAQKNLLRLGVVLYALRISFQDIAAVGLPGLALDVFVIATVLVLGTWAGQRWLKLDRDTAILTASGSAICGAAAVLAVERVLRAEPGQVAMAVATVVLFGTLDIFLYPALYPWLGLDAHAFGLFTGATVHEVAQVVAVGSAISPATTDTAVIVKLTRVMLLMPVLVVIGWRVGHRAGSGERRGIVPGFAIGFLGVAILNSLVDVPEDLKGALLTFDTFLLATAMAALGMETRWTRLRTLGPRPLLLALVLFLWLFAAGLTVTHWLV